MTLWSKVKAYFSGWPEGSIERIQKQEEPERPHLQGMTKKELEAYGRTIGVELDRRHTKKQLIKTLQSSW